MHDSRRDIEEIKTIWALPKKVVISTHHKPDADALGSSLALAKILEKKGHKVTVIVPSDYPGFLNWMSGQEQVIIFDPKTPETVKPYMDEAELFCILDLNAFSRLYELGDLIRTYTATPKILIDHHLSPEADMADMYFWDNKAAATCELIYELIVAIGDKALIDKDIAEALYAGIMTDTGSFRFPSTSSKVHIIISELIEIGADNATVYEHVFDEYSESRLRFIGFALSKRLVVLREFHTAYFVISAKDLANYQSKTGDTEGLVDFGLSIEGILFACVMIEREDNIKLSFRSSGDFSVQNFAATNFSGGGHKNASGGICPLSLKETEHKFLGLLPLYKETLDQVYTHVL